MPGKWFEALEVGQLFRHEIHRTITEADTLTFSAMTHNPARLHTDDEYCRPQTEFGQRILNSAFTLGLMSGIAGPDIVMGTSVANLGWDEARFQGPWSTAIRCAPRRRSWSCANPDGARSKAS